MLIKENLNFKNEKDKEFVQNFEGKSENLFKTKNNLFYNDQHLKFTFSPKKEELEFFENEEVSNPLNKGTNKKKNKNEKKKKKKILNY